MRVRNYVRLVMHVRDGTRLLSAISAWGAVYEIRQWPEVILANEKKNQNKLGLRAFFFGCVDVDKYIRGQKKEQRENRLPKDNQG